MSDLVAPTRKLLADGPCGPRWILADDAGPDALATWYHKLPGF